jgi:signal transduction histidine kinase
LVVVVAALVGHVLAKRTLQPVARASRAARSLAEGLLDTRLPVEREDEFGVWAISFNQMAEALQEKISALEHAHERERRFTSDVSHELRTPLTALVGAASMLRNHMGQMTDEARWPAERLVLEVTRLRALVEELMDISRLDSGRESVATETVVIGDLVASLLDSRGWNADVTLDSDEATVVTDRRRLERILANLIDNALTHGRKNVQVQVRGNKEHTLVDVTDEGPGIPPEHLEHVFDRFYKADPARGGGSGLGLSIALENSNLIGGDLEIGSKPGGGTRSTLRLSSRPAMKDSPDDFTPESLPGIRGAVAGRQP